MCGGDDGVVQRVPARASRPPNQRSRHDVWRTRGILAQIVQKIVPTTCTTFVKPSLLVRFAVRYVLIRSQRAGAFSYTVY